jgi:transcriptional regulator GlxA family with amidase domain
MLLAEAGLVKGRPATTNRGAWAELEAFGAELKKNRVVDDGTLVTAGGVTSGIDLALYVVERELGADVADGIAGAMEYTRDRDVYVSAG